MTGSPMNRGNHECKDRRINVWRHRKRKEEELRNNGLPNNRSSTPYSPFTTCPIHKDVPFLIPGPETVCLLCTSCESPRSVLAADVSRLSNFSKNHLLLSLVSLFFFLCFWLLLKSLFFLLFCLFGVLLHFLASEGKSWGWLETSLLF